MNSERRRLVILLGCVSIALALLAAAPCLQAQDRGSSTFSDTHVHLNNPDKWVGFADSAGVVRTVALAGRDIGNAGLLLAGNRWPGRILPFLSVSPEHREFRAAWEADDERLTGLVDSLLSTGGYFGIGEISVTHFARAGFPAADFDPNGRTMRGLLHLARKHGVPVLIHAEVTRLRELELMLADFPDVTVIWAHGGYTPVSVARKLLNAHSNLIYELSARTWARHPRSPEYTIFQERVVGPEWLALMEAMPSRFLVGTDASARSEGADLDRVRSVQLMLEQLSEPARRRIAHDNLSRILGPAR